MTRPIAPGPLSLWVSRRLRPTSTDLDLVGRLRLVVLLSTWSSWDGPFGHQDRIDGPARRHQRWGPELVSRLATTGACAVDLSAWAAGARFAAVALACWRLESSEAPPVAFDWQLVDGCPALPSDDIWPIAMRTPPLTVGELGPGRLPAETLVSEVSMVRGRRPRVAAVTNTHPEASASVSSVARYGAAVERLTDVAVGPGESLVVARLDEHDPATGLQLYARAETPGVHLTIDYA